MFLELILLALFGDHWRCSQCGAGFWSEDSPSRSGVGVGREYHECICGQTRQTGNREWIQLSRDERRRYLWSDARIIVLTTTALAAIAGYVVRWHEPYWFMAVFFGFLGLITGLICSSYLWLKRGLRVWASLRRTRQTRSSHLAVPN